MATILRFVNTASTAGGDGTTNNTTGATRAYASLNEWEAAEQTDLVSDGDIAEVICSGGLDSASLFITGWTTGASNYILIHATDDKHAGVFDSGKYHLDGGTAIASILEIQEDFVRFFALQFQRQSIATSGVDRACIRTNLVGAGDIRIEDNIFKSIGLNTVGIISAVSFDDSSPVHTFKNNVVYDFDGTTHRGIGGLGASATIDVYNNTFINCTTGMASRANYLCKNNIFQDCATDIGGTVNSSNDNNLTDNGSIPGANSVANSTLTFENKASDNFALVIGDTDAIGAGIGPSSDSNVPTTDIIGEARSGTTTDIGAFMFVGGGGISITGTTPNYSYNAINGTIDLTGEILITGNTPNYAYAALGGSVDLTGAITVVGVTTSYSYQSINGVVDLTGEITVSGQTPNYSYAAINGLVELGALINVIGNTPNYNYQGVNGVVDLTGDISIIGDTPNYSYATISGFVSIGEGQVIGTVTSKFADDLFSADFKLNDISLQFKPSQITVTFKT